MRWIKHFCDIVQRDDIVDSDQVGMRTGFEIASVHIHSRICFVEMGGVPQRLEPDTRAEFRALERLRAKELEPLWRKFSFDQEFRLSTLELVNILQRLTR
jgi:hypothetical protein